jgi:hypothetical protein
MNLVVYSKINSTQATKHIKVNFTSLESNMVSPNVEPNIHLGFVWINSFFVVYSTCAYHDKRKLNCFCYMLQVVFISYIKKLMTIS